MKKILCAILPLAILASCGTNSERKVMVIANGDITASGTSIKVSNPTGGAVEKVLDLKDPDNTTFTLDNNGTKSTIEIKAENGYYILNAMKDPIYGSQLIDGRDYNTDESLGLGKQKLMIDSLKLVFQGKNISKDNKNYLIKPGQMEKISDDLVHARVFGPFQALNNNIDAPEDGKAPVLFKFYSKDELQARLKAVEESYNSTGE